MKKVYISIVGDMKGENLYIRAFSNKEAAEKYIDNTSDGINFQGGDIKELNIEDDYYIPKELEQK